MNITFEDKNKLYDDLTFSWYITSELNEYRLTMTFCGAIDEDGNEDLYSSMNCEIELNEVAENKPYIMQTIKEKIENKLSIELEDYSETIYNTFPDTRNSIYYIDEDSYDSSMDVLKAFIEAAASTLDLDVNIDEIADNIA